MTPLTRLPWVLALAAAAGCAPKKSTTPVVNQQAPIVQTSDPHLVEMIVEPTTSLVTANDRTELGLRVRITAKDLPAAQRPPLDLALVLDTSGSMEGPPIEALRDSARQLAGQLREGDRISVVAFHSHTEVLVPNTIVTKANRGRIDHAIAQIHATGTTDLVGGLSNGLAQLQAGQFPNGINRIVLLSDGVPNSSVALPAMIASIHQQGVSVTSLGFGLDYDTALMTEIARDTGGNFHYLEKPTEVAAVFEDELTKMTTSVARNMQLVIEPGPGVTFSPLPGMTPSSDGKLYTQLGDLPSGETRDLMIPVTVTGRGDGSIVELSQVTLTFDDVIGRSGRKQRDGFVSAKASKDTAQVKAAVKIDLEVARIRATAAAATLQAINLARSGQVGPARQGLATAITNIRAASLKVKDPELGKLIKELEALSQELAQIVVQQQQIIRAQQLEAQRQAKLSGADRIDVQGVAPNVEPPAPATAQSPVIENSLRKREAAANKTVSGH